MHMYVDRWPDGFVLKALQLPYPLPQPPGPAPTKGHIPLFYQDTHPLQSCAKSLNASSLSPRGRWRGWVPQFLGCPDQPEYLDSDPVCCFGPLHVKCVLLYDQWFRCCLLLIVFPSFPSLHATTFSDYLSICSTPFHFLFFFFLSAYNYYLIKIFFFNAKSTGLPCFYCVFLLLKAHAKRFDP